MGRSIAAPRVRTAPHACSGQTNQSAGLPGTSALQKGWGQRKGDSMLGRVAAILKEIVYERQSSHANSEVSHIGVRSKMKFWLATILHTVRLLKSVFSQWDLSSLTARDCSLCSHQFKGAQSSTSLQRSFILFVSLRGRHPLCTAGRQTITSMFCFSSLSPKI